MTASTEQNPIWHQVRLLKPALPHHAEIIEQEWRGRSWYVIQDRVTGNFHRFPEIVAYVLSLMTGKRTLEDILYQVRADRGEEAPSQGDIVLLLGQLYQADLLRNIEDRHAATLGEKRQKLERSAKMGRYLNPIALRFRLFDPDELVQKLQPILGWIFSPVGLVIWACWVIAALIQAGLHWGELTGGLSDRILSADNVFIMLIVYPIVKAWHELGHAVAVRRFGGEVHEIGVLLLAFMPLAYTDTSFSTTFPNKWHRAAVGAAGMIFETILAAGAMFVWTEVEAGWISAICFNMMVLTVISTLLFNINPMIKLDGYYIFSDSMEIPSMAHRAFSLVRWGLCRSLFGVKTYPKPYWVSGELKWLLIYGILSPFYRLFVMLSIALFIAQKFFVFGVFLAIVSLGMALGLPLFHFCRFLFGGTMLKGHRLRAILVSLLIVAGLVGLLGYVPMPYWTNSLGVVQAQSQTLVRAEGTGQIENVRVANGDYVEKGQVLYQMEDPYLFQMQARLVRELEENEHHYQALRYQDNVEAAIILEDQKLLKSQQNLINTKIKNLQIIAPRSGYFLSQTNPEDTLGGFLNQGTLVGYVVQPGEVFVQAIVDQEKIEPVRTKLSGVTLMMVEGAPYYLESSVLREPTKSTNLLPSLALSTVGGGDLSLDPSQQKDLGSRGTPRPYAYSEQFIYDLDLPLEAKQAMPLIGQRVYVRFEHQSEPLAPRLYRIIRQTFLKRLNV